MCMRACVRVQRKCLRSRAVSGTKVRPLERRPSSAVRTCISATAYANHYQSSAYSLIALSPIGHSSRRHYAHTQSNPSHPPRHVCGVEAAAAACALWSVARVRLHSRSHQPLINRLVKGARRDWGVGGMGISASVAAPRI